MPHAGLARIHHLGLKEDDNQEFKNNLSKLDQIISYLKKSDYFRIGYDYATSESMLHEYYYNHEFYRASSDMIGHKKISETGKIIRISWGRIFWWLHKYSTPQGLLKKFGINNKSEFLVYQKKNSLEIKLIPSDEFWKKQIKVFIKKYKYPQRKFGYRLFYMVPLSKKDYNKLKSEKEPFIFIAGRSKQIEDPDKHYGIQYRKHLIKSKDTLYQK